MGNGEIHVAFDYHPKLRMAVFVFSKRLFCLNYLSLSLEGPEVHFNVMRCQARGTCGWCVFSSDVFAVEAPCTFIHIRATWEGGVWGGSNDPFKRNGERPFHFPLRQPSSPRVIERRGKCLVSSVSSYLSSRGLGNSERLNSRPGCQRLQCFSLEGPCNIGEDVSWPRRGEDK